MNVSFVLPDGIESLGGVTSWSLEMAHKLSQRNCSVSLLEYANATSHAANASVSPDIRVLQCHGAHPRGAAADDVIANAAPVYRNIVPGIVIPNYDAGTYAACAAVLSRPSTALHVIGTAHSDVAWYYDWLCYYEPIIQVFLAVSDEIAGRLQERLPHRKHDIVVRPYAVETPAPLERTYSSGDQPIQLVYAGRIQEEQKRVSDLLRLAQKLSEKGVLFELNIVGDGPGKEDFLARLGGLDETLRRQIHYKGQIPHEAMSDVWRRSDICLLVSDYEGTSIAMLEAMAHGCVPVVTNVSGTDAVIHLGENGYFTPVGDMEGMANIIQHLFLRRPTLQALGLSAHQTICEHFSYEKYLEWFLRLLHRIDGLPPRTWPSAKPLIFVPTPYSPTSWKERLPVPVRTIGRYGKRALQYLRNTL